MKILVIGGTSRDRGELDSHLNKSWFKAELAAINKPEGLIKAIRTESPDLIVIYPAIDIGVETLEKIRSSFLEVPIMILSEDHSISTEVVWLAKGADEYLTKPVHQVILLARVRVLLRRSREILRPDPLICGDLVINIAGWQATLCGNSIELSPTEFRLLCLLAENVGNIVSREVAFSRIWPSGAALGSVKTYIGYLREKLESDPSNPQMIVNVRGRGYKLVSPTAQE